MGYWISSNSGRNCSKDGTAVVNEAFKFHNLRDEVEINGNSVRSYDGFDFQRDAGVTCFKLGRSRRGHDVNLNRPSSASSTTDSRDLRRSKLRRVTEFSDDFDHRALPTLRCDPRSRKEINSFLLVQRTDDNLELRIGEDAGQPEDTGRDGRCTHRGEQKRVNGVRADRKIAAAITSRDWILADRSAVGVEWKIRRDCVDGCSSTGSATGAE